MIRTLLLVLVGSLGGLLFLLLFVLAIRSGRWQDYATAATCALITQQMFSLIRRKPGTPDATPSNSLSTRSLLVCLVIGIAIALLVVAVTQWMLR